MQHLPAQAIKDKGAKLVCQAAVPVRTGKRFSLGCLAGSCHCSGVPKPGTLAQCTRKPWVSTFQSPSGSQILACVRVTWGICSSDSWAQHEQVWPVLLICIPGGSKAGDSGMALGGIWKQPVWPRVSVWNRLFAH